MKLQKRGKSTSKSEILNVSEFGIWILILDQEYFLSYENFPWFKTATIEQIYDYELVHDRHLYWPALDVDISLESLKSPEKYPLIARS